MNDTPDLPDPDVASAGQTLARLNAQVSSMRSVLVRLLQDVVVAEGQLANGPAAQLAEANEQLVLAAMRNTAEADTAAQALDEATRSAELDPLTQLPNRVLLLDRFNRAITTAERHSARLALLYLDIDNFKQINDTLGHAVGDEVLQQVAQCLTASVREADTVSRQGGDEFLILLTEIARPADAVRVAEKVLAAVEAQDRANGSALRLSLSIGISVYPEDGSDADTLISKADAAMYRAKRHGAGSFACHGQEPVGERSPAPSPVAPRHKRAAHYELALAEQARRHADLQEANEKLVLAVINAQELQAAAEQAQQRQAEFMSAVSQELRNPLAPIRIATAMLGRARTDEPLLPRVQALVDAHMEHMSRLVGEQLDAARAPADASKSEHRSVDMAGIVESAVVAFRPVMDARQQQFEQQLPAHGLEVLGDPVGLAQIVGNLLDNASKYTPDGGHIALSVAVAGDSMLLTVSDRGIGITAQALPHVFELFAQDTHALGFNGVGSGIGLTAVRELVEAHGGTVSAHSAGSGLGSEFTVTLPLIGSAGTARH